ncbi:MAG: MFS transporter, partial [Acidobacteria bacterium]|nr:MFS transporter [Candidatus Sulfomarinibacter sp. MAG AM1]
MRFKDRPPLTLTLNLAGADEKFHVPVSSDWNGASQTCVVSKPRVLWEDPLSQLHLLTERRFWPLFWTQFLGAFNDNLFKNALAILIAYRSMTLLGIGSATIVVACAGIFIFPFFLFSATAGQLADHFPKWRLIRWVKVWEIGVMILAGVGFATNSVALLLVVLFLMGTQSAFFGPAKFAILPELLDEHSLVGGNAMVAMATFLAILLGTITGGLVVAGGDRWVSRLGLIVVTVAVLGLVASLFVKKTPAANPDLPVRLELVKPTIDILRVTRRVHPVFLSVLAVSWFWFLGASFLSILPNFSKDVLGGGETVVTLCLATFCVGIGTGSMLCEKLSRRRLELGLVPLGSIGISVFALDLAFSGWRFAAPIGGPLSTVGEFLHQPGSAHILFDLFMIAVFSGFYTVPLMTFIQQRSVLAERSRVIAGNNILNALFIVASSVMLVVMVARGFSYPAVFLVLALLNAAAAVYIYSVVPEFLLRFVSWCTANLLYRLRVEKEDGIPAEGPALLVANHVSFVDWLLIAAASPRPVRFVMAEEYSRLPLVRFLFRDAKVIPIAPASTDPELLERAYDRIAEELVEGELVCIFPEGGITSDGKLAPFRHGIERIVERTQAPVVPVALVGLWGSFFSRKGGKAMRRPFQRFWSRVTVRVGEAMPPEAVTAQAVAERVAELGGWDVPEAHEPPEENSEFGIRNYSPRRRNNKNPAGWAGRL